MLVKLHDFNRNDKIDRKDAYKAPNGYYYSSEAAYNETELQKEMRKKCIDYIYDILGYDTFMKIPTIFFKKLKEWSPYNYSVIYTAMMLIDGSLRNMLKYKSFSNEYNRAAYIVAVIENHLNDAYVIENRRKITSASVNKIETEHLESVGCSAKVSTSVKNLLGEV